MGPLGVGREVAETMATAQCSLPRLVVGSGLLGVHRQESKPYTELFPGCTMCCMTDLAFTQIKRVYVLHVHSQS